MVWGSESESLVGEGGERGGEKWWGWRGEERGEFWRLRERVGQERRGGEWRKFEKGVSLVERLLEKLFWGVEGVVVDLKAKEALGWGELDSSIDRWGRRSLIFSSSRPKRKISGGFVVMCCEWSWCGVKCDGVMDWRVVDVGYYFVYCNGWKWTENVYTVHFYALNYWEALVHWQALDIYFVRCCITCWFTPALLTTFMQIVFLFFALTHNSAIWIFITWMQFCPTLLIVLVSLSIFYFTEKVISIRFCLIIKTVAVSVFLECYWSLKHCNYKEQKPINSSSNPLTNKCFEMFVNVGLEFWNDLICETGT